MSDKSIFREHWGSGTIASDRPVEGTPQFQDAKHLAQHKIKTQKFGTLTHGEFQAYLDGANKSYVTHSDGFLSLSHISVAPAYECECGFEGLFKSDTCARCSKKLNTQE